MTVQATSPWGAYVNFTASATDAVGPVYLVYSKKNGSQLPLGTTSVSVYAVDGAGNKSAAQTFTVTVVDTTPPALTVPGPMTVEQTSPAGAVVCYSVNATDAVGPITLTYSQASGTTFVAGTTLVTVTAKDGAGNASSATFSVTVVDTTPPVITIKGVSNGGVYKVGQAPTPTFTVSDAGSGVLSSSFTLTTPGTPSGGGMYVYTVTATDKAGHSATQSVTYFVLYNFGGFQKPLVELANYALNAMIPVKLQLTDARGNLVTNAVNHVTVDGAAAVSTGADIGNTMTWDGTQHMYRFYLNTTGLAAGDHLLQVTCDDGTVHEILITLSGGGTNVENGTLSDTSSTVMGGSYITVTGSGYAAGALVTVALGGTTLGSPVIADSRGRISDRILIPTTDASGTWIITATGTAADGGVRVDSAVITITPP